MARLFGPSNWVVLEANCPRCGNYWGDDIFTSRRTGSESRGRIPEGDGLICADCGRVFSASQVQSAVRGSGGKLRESYVRQTQLKSSDGFVHYGMLKRLDQSGYKVPKGFRGTSDDLARSIGISHGDLARLWKTSESELQKRGRFELSD